MIVNERAMPYNTDLPVYVCNGLRYRIEEIWPKFKNHY